MKILRTIGRFLLAASALYLASIPALVLLIGAVQASQGQYYIPVDQWSEPLAAIAGILAVLLGVWVTTEDYSVTRLWAFTIAVGGLFIVLMQVMRVISDWAIISAASPSVFALSLLCIGVLIYLGAEFLVYRMIYNGFKARQTGD